MTGAEVGSEGRRRAAVGLDESGPGVVGVELGAGDVDANLEWTAEDLDLVAGSVGDGFTETIFSEVWMDALESGGR